MLFLWSCKCALHAGSIESRRKVNSISTSQYVKDQEYLKSFSLKVKKESLSLILLKNIFGYLPLQTFFNG